MRPAVLSPLQYLLTFIEALPSSAAAGHNHHHYANGVTGRGRHAPERFTHAKQDDLRQLLLDAKEGLVRGLVHGHLCTAREADPN